MKYNEHELEITIIQMLEEKVYSYIIENDLLELLSNITKGVNKSF